MVDFINASNYNIVPLLKIDGALQEWEAVDCPHCGRGKVGPMKFIKRSGMDKNWWYRCRSKKCQKFILPAAYHPIFSAPKGQSYVPLQIQAAILFCSLANIKRNSVHIILNKNHKLIERIYRQQDYLRMKYVEEKQKKSSMEAFMNGMM